MLQTPITLQTHPHVILRQGCVFFWGVLCILSPFGAHLSVRGPWCCWRCWVAVTVVAQTSHQPVSLAPYIILSPFRRSPFGAGSTVLLAGGCGSGHMVASPQHGPRRHLQNQKEAQCEPARVQKVRDERVSRLAALTPECPFS